MMMMITTMAKKIRHFFPETREREREKKKKKKKTKKKRTQRARFLLFSLSLSLSKERRDFLSAQQPQRRIEKKENDKRRLLLRERGPIMKRGLYACPNTSQTLNNTAHKKKEKKEFNNSPECIFYTFLIIFTCEKNTNTTYYILYRTTRRLCDRYTHYISSTRFSRREEEETQNTEPL